MSDFLSRLLKRHISTGQKVEPRTRARFEPEVMATFLPESASKIAVKEIDNHHSQQESFQHIMSMLNSSANDHAKDKMDDSSSVKKQLHDQHSPDIRSGESIEREITRELQDYSSPKSARRTISETPKNIKKDIREIHATPGGTEQELVRQSKNVSGEMAAPSEFNIEKDLDDKVHNTLRRLLPPDEQGHSVKSTNRDNIKNTVKVRTQEGSRNQQSDQHQPSSTTLQNTQTESQGLLETPPWLFNRPRELHKELISKNPKIENEPIVNVTIGRIEVRATQLQAQKQSLRKRKPSDVMSLDKYLSKRIQGGRR